MGTFIFSGSYVHSAKMLRLLSVALLVVVSTVLATDNRVCWRHVAPGCVNAHNIVRYRDKTVDECKALCKAHPDCKAFEYGVNHGGSRKVYRAGDCQLNTGSFAKNCDGKDNNLDLYVKIGCKQNVCWKKASPACSPAHNIKRVHDLTLDQCKMLCSKTEGCVAFEYGVNHGGARKHYRPGDCQLNTWKKMKGCDGVWNNLDFYMMKECDTTCYKHISPGCVRGSNIRRVRSKSVEACKSICAVTPNCVGFEYGVNHGGARKHYRVGDCQLNTWTKTDNCDGHYNNLDFYIMYDCAKGSGDEHNFSIW